MKTQKQIRIPAEELRRHDAAARRRAEIEAGHYGRFRNQWHGGKKDWRRQPKHRNQPED